MPFSTEIVALFNGLPTLPSSAAADNKKSADPGAPLPANSPLLKAPAPATPTQMLLESLRVFGVAQNTIRVLINQRHGTASAAAASGSDTDNKPRSAEGMDRMIEHLALITKRMSHRRTPRPDY